MNSDCFANSDKNRCSILNNKKCKDCKFYKTVMQLKLDRQASGKRIRSLRPLKQIYILKKYRISERG